MSGSERTLPWRNPKKELPQDGETVWVLVEPHKDRGSLKASAMGIMIGCGQANVHGPGFCRIENNDELGYGNSGWLLRDDSDDWTDERGIAWLPLDEFPLPSWEVKL